MRSWPEACLAISTAILLTAFTVRAATAQVDAVSDPDPEAVSLYCLAFSPDSAMIVTGGDSVRVHDALLGQLMFHARLPRTTRTVVFSPNGEELVSAGDDGVVRFWSVLQEEPLRTINFENKVVWNVAFSPDGRLLAAASPVRVQGRAFVSEGELRVWNAKTGELVHAVKPANHAVRAITFSKSGALLACSLSSNDKSLLEVYDVASWERAHQIEFGPGQGLSVGFRSDSELVITGGICVPIDPRSCRPTGKIWLIDLNRANRVVQAPVEQCDYFSSVSMTPNRDRFATGSSFRRKPGDPRLGDFPRSRALAEIQMRDARSGKVLWRADGEAGDPYGVRVSPNGNVVACCSGEKILVFDAELGGLVRSIDVRTARLPKR